MTSCLPAVTGVSFYGFQSTSEQWLASLPITCPHQSPSNNTRYIQHLDAGIAQYQMQNIEATDQQSGQTDLDIEGIGCHVKRLLAVDNLQRLKLQFRCKATCHSGRLPVSDLCTAC